MRAVLWVLAVLSHWTVIHRVYHTRGELLRAEGMDAEPVATTSEVAGRDAADEMLGNSVRQS